MKNTQIGLILIVILQQICNGQVNTPNGVPVPAAALFVYSAVKYSDAQLQSEQNNIQNGAYGSSCVILSGYSRNYNCHGYAWHVSTGGAQTCIDQVSGGGVTPYAAGVNPSYTQTSYNSTIGKTRIRYSGDHSAVTTFDGKFISKWGPGPLVKHNALDVPLAMATRRRVGPVNMLHH